MLTLPFSLGVVDMIKSVPDGDVSACCIPKKPTRIINTSKHQTILDALRYMAGFHIVIRIIVMIMFVFLWYWQYSCQKNNM